MRAGLVHRIDTSFSARSQTRLATASLRLFPSPAVMGITHYTLYQSPCASRSLWTPSSGHFPPPHGTENDLIGVRYVR